LPGRRERDARTRGRVLHADDPVRRDVGFRVVRVRGVIVLEGSDRADDPARLCVAHPDQPRGAERADRRRDREQLRTERPTGLPLEADGPLCRCGRSVGTDDSGVPTERTKDRAGGACAHSHERVLRCCDGGCRNERLRVTSVRGDMPDRADRVATGDRRGVPVGQSFPVRRPGGILVVVAGRESADQAGSPRPAPALKLCAEVPSGCAIAAPPFVPAVYAIQHPSGDHTGYEAPCTRRCVLLPSA